MGKIEDRIRQAAEEDARQQQFEKEMEAQRETLYNMKIFETLAHPGGWPMVMRVPGGWIFYIQTGGSKLITSEIEPDLDGNPVVGSTGQVIVGHPMLLPTFVPYTEADQKRVLSS